MGGCCGVAVAVEVLVLTVWCCCCCFHVSALPLPLWCIMSSAFMACPCDSPSACVASRANRVAIQLPVYGIEVNCPNSDLFPWQGLLGMVPFAPNVCVAGSAATWFACQRLTGRIPDWTPSDIDIFVYDSEQQFQLVAQLFETSIVLLHSSGGHHACFQLERIVHGINIDFYFSKSSAVPFKISFVRSVSAAVIDTFDISVCQVIMHTDGGSGIWRCYMPIATSDDIINGNMTCFFPVRRAVVFYSQMRTALRIIKYQMRGFRLREYIVVGPNMRLMVTGTDMHCNVSDVAVPVFTESFLPSCVCNGSDGVAPYNDMPELVSDSD